MSTTQKMDRNILRPRRHFENMQSRILYASAVHSF